MVQRNSFYKIETTLQRIDCRFLYLRMAVMPTQQTILYGLGELRHGLVRVGTAIGKQRYSGLGMKTTDPFLGWFPPWFCSGSGDSTAENSNNRSLRVNSTTEIRFPQSIIFARPAP